MLSTKDKPRHDRKQSIARLIVAMSICLMLVTNAVIICFGIVGNPLRAATFSHDEQKVYDFLIQTNSHGQTNAQIIGITDLEDSSKWTVPSSAGGIQGFYFSPSGNVNWIGDKRGSTYYPLSQLSGSLDLSNCTSLLYVNISSRLTGIAGDGLTDVNLYGCTSLYMLMVSGKGITEIDLSTNTNLRMLDLHNMGITELDISNHLALTDFSFYGNDVKLTSLDVSQHVELTRLILSDNELTSLDVSHNTKLKYLNVRNSQITSLDLSHNNALTELYYYGNPLIELNVSRCTLLTYWFDDPYKVIDASSSISTTPLAATLADPDIESFILFPYTEAGEQYAHATIDVNGTEYELTVKFDVDFTLPSMIYATVSINDLTDEIEFNVNIESPTHELLGYKDEHNLAVSDWQTDGDWERFTATFTDTDMSITLDYLDGTPDPTCTCDICPICGGCVEDVCCGAGDCDCFPCTCDPVDPGPDPTDYTVTFILDGEGDVPPPVSVTEGGKVIKPTGTFTKEGYTFAGWAKQGSEVLWNFENDTVDDDIVLVAVWEPVGGGEPPVIPEPEPPIDPGNWFKNFIHSKWFFVSIVALITLIGCICATVWGLTNNDFFADKENKKKNKNNNKTE